MLRVGADLPLLGVARCLPSCIDGETQKKMKPIYVIGCGAIGYPLAAQLVRAGRPVIGVRTSRTDMQQAAIPVGVHNGANRTSVSVETVSLSNLTEVDGTIVVATKAYTNGLVAQTLRQISAIGPIVIMQNGLNVEEPFLAERLPSVYRCVLYATSQAKSECEFTFSPIGASPVGVVRGDELGLEECVAALTTDEFPFRPEPHIQREVWKKTIINSVFNSICPLLEVDNGIFVRSEEVADLARELVAEGVAVTDKLNMGIQEAEVIGQIMRISEGSRQLISTLQDLRMADKPKSNI